MGNPPSKERKPWEDEWGNPLPDEEIKKISQNWMRPQWEEYLQSLEVSSKEKLGKKWDALKRVEIFAQRGEEEFEENTKYDLAEAKSQEEEARAYLKSPIIEETENPAYEEVLNAEDESERRAALVRAALDFLTPSERFVIEKYFWDGWSEPRIARGMRRKRPSIQTWKMRALGKIRDRLSSVLPIVEGTQKYPTKPRKPLNLRQPAETLTEKGRNRTERVNSRLQT